MYLKLIVNAIINPLTAIHDIANGQLIANDRLKPDASSLLQELTPLLTCLLPKMSTDEIASHIVQVAQNTANNSSSMRQDLKAGKQTEIDFITGYLIKQAKSHQIELSQHATILNKIKRLEQE